jgi:endonuclease/exonuclease/phosphatase (EEP) superfamily protein YafD
VELLNVHLRPAVAGPGNWMEVHRATRPDRNKEVEAYLLNLPAADARLIVGDFNELPEGDLFQTLSAAGLDSALPRASERGATWRWEGAVPPLEAQIDHVAYARSSFELVSAKVLSGGNSDHVPIVVTLRHRP